MEQTNKLYVCTSMYVHTYMYNIDSPMSKLSLLCPSILYLCMYVRSFSLHLDVHTVHTKTFLSGEENFNLIFHMHGFYCMCKYVHVCTYVCTT